MSGWARVCSYSGSGARSMPLGQATVPASGSTITRATRRVVKRLQDAGPPLRGEVHVSCCAVAEEQAQHVVGDDRNARDDRQILLAHSHHARAAVLWQRCYGEQGLVTPRRC